MDERAMDQARREKASESRDRPQHNIEAGRPIQAIAKHDWDAVVEGDEERRTKETA